MCVHFAPRVHQEGLTESLAGISFLSDEVVLEELFGSEALLS